MKRFFLILLLFITTLSFSQNDLSNFSGDIILKETKYLQDIDRYVVDDYINYYDYEVKNDICITHVLDSFYPDLNDHDYDCIHMKLLRDSIYQYYLIDKSTQFYDSILMYSLHKQDTIDGNQSYYHNFEYKYVCLHGSDEPELQINHNYRDNAGYNTVYIGDKTLHFKNFKLDCYVFEKTNASMRSFFEVKI